MLEINNYVGVIMGESCCGSNTNVENKEYSEDMKVSADLTIGEAVFKFPEIVEPLQKYGIHCVGCGAAAFETISQGLMAHGFTEEDISKIINELNDTIKEKRKSLVIKTESKKEDQKDDVSQLEKPILSEAAIKKLKDLMENSKKSGYGLRLKITPGGCAGFSYGMDFEKDPKSDDIIYEQGDLKVFIDSESLQMLSGSTIDYVETLNESGFKFTNSNASTGCGCGKSFR